jgi:hypothetical protein
MLTIWLKTHLRSLSFASMASFGRPSFLEQLQSLWKKSWTAIVRVSLRQARPLPIVDTSLRKSRHTDITLSIGCGLLYLQSPHLQRCIFHFLQRQHLQHHRHNGLVTDRSDLTISLRQSIPRSGLVLPLLFTGKRRLTVE